MAKIVTRSGQRSAPPDAADAERLRRHRILIAAAVAAAVEGPFRIVSVEREPDNRWGRSGRFRNRTPRPPSWTTHAAASAEFAAADPAPKSEAPDQGGQSS
jgi:hypothetical protein